MNKCLFILFILIYPFIASSQSVKVEGELKVTTMDLTNTENHLVVHRPDGTLGTREVSSLPPPTEVRTLQSDLLLTSLLCQCTNMPPAMIQSLQDNGYTVQDLTDFQVPLGALLDAGISTQALLDAGQSPQDLVNSGLLTDSLYGKIYQAGYIFYYSDVDESGLVAALADHSTVVEWGCLSTPIGGAEGTAIGTGELNTEQIVDDCSTIGIAAEVCFNLVLDGYDDWFLPSKEELNEIYEIIGPGADAPLTNVGELNQDIYWSSSEFNLTTAWAMSFPNGGGFFTYGRDRDGYVRPVRAF